MITFVFISNFIDHTLWNFYRDNLREKCNSIIHQIDYVFGSHELQIELQLDGELVWPENFNLERNAGGKMKKAFYWENISGRETHARVPRRNSLASSPSTSTRTPAHVWISAKSEMSSSIWDAPESCRRIRAYGSYLYQGRYGLLQRWFAKKEQPNWFFGSGPSRSPMWRERNLFPSEHSCFSFLCFAILSLFGELQL